jgi:hypothetical protein
METQTHNIRYIVLHIVPTTDWHVMNMGDKMEFNYVVTANGKKRSLTPVQPTDGCISVVYVGSIVYARRSAALVALLLELNFSHPQARIVDCVELYQNGNAVLMTATSDWLQQQLPEPIQQLCRRFKNLLFLQSLLPQN